MQVEFYRSYPVPAAFLTLPKILNVTLQSISGMFNADPQHQERFISSETLKIHTSPRRADQNTKLRFDSLRAVTSPTYTPPYVPGPQYFLEV